MPCGMPSTCGFPVHDDFPDHDVFTKMTVLQPWRNFAPLAGFAVLLLTPGLAIQWGMLPFAYRVHALLAVSGICISLCLWAGFSLRELGLGRPSLRSHWIGCATLTLALAAIMVLAARW